MRGGAGWSRVRRSRLVADRRRGGGQGIDSGPGEAAADADSLPAGLDGFAQRERGVREHVDRLRDRLADGADLGRRP
jgi:hypothetical protein